MIHCYITSISSEWGACILSSHINDCAETEKYIMRGSGNVFVQLYNTLYCITGNCFIGCFLFKVFRGLCLLSGSLIIPDLYVIFFFFIVYGNIVWLCPNITMNEFSGARKVKKVRPHRSMHVFSISWMICVIFFSVRVHFMVVGLTFFIVQIHLMVVYLTFLV